MKIAELGFFDQLALSAALKALEADPYNPAVKEASIEFDQGSTTRISGGEVREAARVIAGEGGARFVSGETEIQLGRGSEMEWARERREPTVRHVQHPRGRITTRSEPLTYLGETPLPEPVHLEQRQFFGLLPGSESTPITYEKFKHDVEMGYRIKRPGLLRRLLGLTG